MNNHPVLRTAAGTPVADNQSSQTETVPRIIRERQPAHCDKAGPDYGPRVARGLGVAIEAIVGQAA
jgi:catalase